MKKVAVQKKNVEEKAKANKALAMKKAEEKPVEFEVVEEETPQKEVEKVENKKDKSLLREIVRFVVVGVVATLIDFVVELAIVYCFGFTNWIETYEWASYVIWAIAVVVGFLVSTIVNYLLSYIWVFKNVDRKKVKRSFGSFCLFTLLSAIGLGIGVGLQLLGNYVALVSFNIDLGDLTTGIITNLQQGWGTAIAFVIIFVIKTIVTMVYNFVSRKFLIFKKPKEEEAKEN